MLVDANSLLLEEAPAVAHELAEQRPDHCAVPIRDGRPFPEAFISCSARTTGLTDGTKPYRTTSGSRLVDEPMAQLHGGASRFQAARFSISPAFESASGM